MKGKNQKFREKQKWEETQIKRVSIRGYNPPAPERISELMLDLYNYFLFNYIYIAIKICLILKIKLL